MTESTSDIDIDSDDGNGAAIDAGQLSFAGLEPEAPDLPPDGEVVLPELGPVWVRDIPGPEGAPTIVLFHGWTATSDLNWHTCYAPLAEHYRVLALDHRGHGRGIRSRRPFRLEHCADDAAQITAELGIETFIPVGYSMGGTVAQLTWQRHRDRVDGLVLCATAPYFAGRRPERLSFVGLTGLAAVARYTPAQARGWITGQLYVQRKTEQMTPWGAEQIERHDWRMVLEAGKAIGSFSSTEWIGDVDVPTSVIVTTDDHVIPLRRQVKLWRSIPDADVFRVHGPHNSVVTRSDRFVPQLLRAVGSVASRVERVKRAALTHG